MKKMKLVKGFKKIKVWKLSQIPPCLGLCRKNPNKGVLVGLSPILKVDLFWICFEMKISGKKKKGKIPHSIFQPDTPLLRRRSARLGEGLHLGEPEDPKIPVSASHKRRFASPRRRSSSPRRI